MKFYITTESIKRFKKSFLNLKNYTIISIENILEEYGYSYDSIDEYGEFMINSKINDIFLSVNRSKKIKGVIYVNPYMTEETIINILDKVSNISQIEGTVLLDDYNTPKMKKHYKHFNEIIYFPLLKKVRLIECTEIKL